MFSVNQAHSLGSNLMNTEEQTSWVWNPNDSQQITMDEPQNDRSMFEKNSGDKN